jgi:hypothetical protein
MDRSVYSKMALLAAFRPLTKSEVRFDVKFYTEDTPLEGNVMATEDAAADKKAEENVRHQLRLGNMYAWCSVVVSAKWSGFCGQVSVGCCSYKNEKAAHRGVDEDGMKDNALTVLNTIILQELAQLSRLLDGSDAGAEHG